MSIRSKLTQPSGPRFWSYVAIQRANSLCQPDSDNSAAATASRASSTVVSPFDHDTHSPGLPQNSFATVASPLDHPKRSHPRHTARQTRFVNDFDHIVHVLVCIRMLIRESVSTARYRGDAVMITFLVD